MLPEMEKQGEASGRIIGAPSANNAPNSRCRTQVRNREGPSSFYIPAHGRDRQAAHVYTDASGVDGGGYLDGKFRFLSCFLSVFLRWDIRILEAVVKEAVVKEHKN